ncbi:MAG: indole-3-glycerol phosphate synthase TrpC [Fibrobacter sp.]|nr:indole-3-glycerol phosphate synthase TrpC [Fibrobacter sp.]
MATILDTIIEQKRIEVKELKKQRSSFEHSGRKKRSFLQSIQIKNGLGIIAEVKKASPSKGVISKDFDPLKIAHGYESGGARAISVLTDEKFFQGKLAYLDSVRNAVSLPVLRKDFIIDTVQVEQTAEVGADAMLLIAAVLDDYQLKDLFQSAVELSIEPLIEIHNTQELDRVMKIEPKLIGINNRNLNTFVTDISVTTSLVKIIPPEVCVVSESGIETGEQAQTLKSSGVKALLVGESLVKKGDPSILIKELMCEE